MSKVIIQLASGDSKLRDAKIKWVTAADFGKGITLNQLLEALSRDDGLEVNKGSDAKPNHKEDK